jgi:tetratricopeptide (TPR) repeat protein
MPRPYASARFVPHPPPAVVYTDRTEEQALLRKVLAPVRLSADIRNQFLTVFYGLGGVGKTWLCRQVPQIVEELSRGPEKESIVLIRIDFDASAWRPERAFVDVARQLIEELTDAKIDPKYSRMLLSEYQRRDVRSDVGRTSSLALVSKTARALGLTLDLLNVPFSSVVARALQPVLEPALEPILRPMLEKYHQRQAQKDQFLRGLLPEGFGGRTSPIELERRIGEAIVIDVRQYLVRNPSKHVRFVFDGFDRLQGDVGRDDAQKNLQAVLGAFLAGDCEDPLSRVRVVIFGRERIRWDDLYGDPEWRECWNQHHLKGFNEGDARAFVAKCRAWLLEKGSAELAEMIARHEGQLLLAANEQSAGTSKSYHPYYIDLGLNIAERAHARGEMPEFGRTPTEIQDLLLRYLDGDELRALMILSLVGVFDEDLFDWLARENLIRHTVGTLQSSLLRGRSYVEAVEGQQEAWRFHRKFEEALRARWKGSEELRAEGRAMIASLLRWFSERLDAVDASQWTRVHVEYWGRAMELILRESGVDGLLVEWQGLFGEWNTRGHRLGGARVPALREIIKRHKERIGLDVQPLLVALDELAGLLADTGDAEEAEKLYKEAIAERRKIQRTEDPELLAALNNLAVLLQDVGRYDEALKIHEEVRAVKERNPKPDDSDILVTLSNLAILYGSMGLYEKAEDLLGKILTAWEKSGRPIDAETSAMMNSLALLTRDIGRAQEAESLLSELLERMTRSLNPEDPLLLLTRSNLALAFADRGKLLEAEGLQRQVLAERRKTFGADHVETLRSLSNLASLLHRIGDLKEAEEKYREALEGRMNTLGPVHPDTLASKGNLAVLLGEAGQMLEAESMCREVLQERRRVLGPEHPDVLRSQHNLAAFLFLNGKREEAEQTAREAYESRRRTLTPKHPDSQESLAMLVEILRGVGKYAEAATLESNSSAGQLRAPGQENPRPGAGT